MRNIFNKMIFILFLFMVGNLYAQSCQELYEENTKRYKQLLGKDPSMAQWLDIRDEIKKLETNACEGEFTDEEERYILEYLIDICKKVSDFKQYFTYRDELFQLMEDSTNAIDLEEEGAEWDKKIITKNYGTLRVKLDLEDDMTGMKKMAVLKSKIGKNKYRPIDMRFDYPENAIHRETLKAQSIRRLEFLQLEISRGNLEFNFDGYDRDSKSFYFEIPYVPLLKKSGLPSRWYAITLDNKKRYRINYNVPDVTLTIKPEENWVLINQLPEKWIKLTFDKSLKNIEFRNIDENRVLKQSLDDYIKIDRGDDVDYYLPSNQRIKIDLIPSRGFIYTVSNTLNILFPFVLIIAGVSVL